MPTALLVAHHYPPHVGGLELVVERQARSLAEAGYQVVVLTSKFGAARAARASQDCVDVIRVGCWHLFERLFFIPFPLFAPNIVSETWRQIRRADVVHIHDVFYISSWVAAVLAALARKPMLLTQHVALVEHSSRLVMGIQRAVYATAGRWIFARARSVVVYNENVRNFLRGHSVPDERILLLANGIDTARFRPAGSGERREIRARHGLPQDRPLVLFVGRLVEKKGYQILLDAKDGGFDLVFVGPGEVPPQGRQPGVHWLGAVGQEQLPELYRACDVFAFPAVGEIFTLVMQEAMASALPVVTTDDPAYHRSIVSDRVVLCPRRAEDLREALLKLLADSPRLRALGSASRELAVKHFDWQANFRRLIQRYSDVLGGGVG
jgi:glycosyltransferase involved in cell wall biosynthesis